jgi:hypothetical protein
MVAIKQWRRLSSTWNVWFAIKNEQLSLYTHHVLFMYYSFCCSDTGSQYDVYIRTVVVDTKEPKLNERIHPIHYSPATIYIVGAVGDVAYDPKQHASKR